MGRTSVERTAYPRFKRLVSAQELHLFFAPPREEAAWAAERTDAAGDQLALLLALKSYQRVGRLPRPEEYPEACRFRAPRGGSAGGYAGPGGWPYGGAEAAGGAFLDP
ncbi:DUF4158 domain-containing protein [Streptomyces sp. NPDC051546]|uniref:DUF4158 domain-containing protein n=1 Tax=Streptomyces sp. NPDC051546 TaxID=3365655 RepID=UPI0037AE6745